MPFISISIDIKQATKALSDDAMRQVPFAAAKAVTALAFAVQSVERGYLSTVFDHPRPFTARAAMVNKATKASPTAMVYIRPEAAAYLAPYEFGGTQHLPGKGLAALVPVGLRTDQYGQIRGRPSAIGARPGVFVGTVQTARGPVWGFWQRIKSKGKSGGPKLKLLIEAEAARTTTKRLGFVEAAREVVATQAAAFFNAELAKVLASKR